VARLLEEHGDTKLTDLLQTGDAQERRPLGLREAHGSGACIGALHAMGRRVIPVYGAY
jgi:hypothetical protein